MTVRNPELVKNGIKGGVLIGGGGAGLGGEENGMSSDERRRSRRESSRTTERDSLVMINSQGEQVYDPESFGGDEEHEGGLGGEGEEDPTIPRLVFMPPDPTYYFRRLYELLLHHDYSLMSSLPPDEDVSLSILSPLHETLLLLVRKRWRIPVTLKAATFVGLVAGLYKGMGVPEECVGEALEEVERVEEKWRYWRWPLVDVSPVSLFSS